MQKGILYASMKLTITCEECGYTFAHGLEHTLLSPVISTSDYADWNLTINDSHTTCTKCGHVHPLNEVRLETM